MKDELRVVRAIVLQETLAERRESHDPRMAVTFYGEMLSPGETKAALKGIPAPAYRRGGQECFMQFKFRSIVRVSRERYQVDVDPVSHPPSFGFFYRFTVTLDAKGDREIGKAEIKVPN